METILVTGGSGFIGSNFIPLFMKNNPDYYIINIDKLTYASINNCNEHLSNNPNYRFVKGDINNYELLEYIFDEYTVKGIIHFAAESHVDNSINDPDIFIRTNINGTHMLLKLAQSKWMTAPFKHRVGFESSRFHHVSTDEVYGSLETTGLFSEKSAYAPNSPYSASKASSDMLVRSYNRTFGLNTVITNCSNNFGPNQHNEKFIPTIINRALSLQSIPIFGDGKNVRDWIYVTDHCRGIEIVFKNGLSGETYNIGGQNEKENIYIANKICSILDTSVPELLKKSNIKSFNELIKFVPDRPGHDKRYAVDSSKIINELSWNTQESFDTALHKTVEWYLKNRGIYE